MVKYMWGTYFLRYNKIIYNRLGIQIGHNDKGNIEIEIDFG